MSTVLIDTHCHLDFPVFDHDREQIISDCRVQGIRNIIVPGVTRNHWPRLTALTAYYSELLPALGLHPCFMTEHQDDDVAQLGTLLQTAQAVAVGEIGLDFHVAVDNSAQQAQIHLLKEQLRVACQARLPVLLHVRKAHDQVLKALREMQFQEGGIVHAYSGSESQAKRYLDAGFCLGIGGGATYDRAQRLHRLIRTLPASAFVLETDAPDISPQFARGERNSPANLLRIASCIAGLTGTDLTQFLATTTANAVRILHLH